MGLVVDYPPGTPALRAIALEAELEAFEAAELEPLEKAFALTDDQEQALEVLGRAEIAAGDALGLASGGKGCSAALVRTGRGRRRHRRTVCALDRARAAGLTGERCCACDQAFLAVAMTPVQMEIAELAVQAKALPAGAPLREHLQAFAELVALKCAEIASGYGDVDDNPADHIRAVFLDTPDLVERLAAHRFTGQAWLAH